MKDSLPPKDIDDPCQSVGFVIHDVARLMRWSFDRRAQKIGLTRSQWSVLLNLKRNNGIRQTELAAILELQPITLGRLIDRLEKDGWVERREDPSDRRAKCIFLTRKVTPMLEKMADLGLETRCEALAGISEKEQRQLIDTLQRMRANLTSKG